MTSLISFDAESLVKQKADTKGRSWETSLVARSTHTSVFLCDLWTFMPFKMVYSLSSSLPTKQQQNGKRPVIQLH